MQIEPPLTAEAFAEAANVSRETVERFTIYLSLLTQWQPRINLVAESTLGDPWRRHFLDSAQLYPHLPPGEGPLVDLGSGAGFPGLVLAMLGVSGVILVESDVRKSAFLREVAAQTGTSVTIQSRRAEVLKITGARAVTARGFAPLVRLIPAAVPFLASDGAAVLLKGKRYREEEEEARKSWDFSTECFPSQSDAEGVILRLTSLCRR